MRFIGTTLLKHLTTFSNVQPTFVMLGFSNGAALVNRILIESLETRIVAAITDGSQLNGLQYRGGTFYVGGPSNAYTTSQPTLASRRRWNQRGATPHPAHLPLRPGVAAFLRHPHRGSEAW